MTSSGKQRAGLAALIVLLTVLVYLPALRAGFVWDDDLLLKRNPLVQSGDGLWRMWVPSAEIDYYPLTWASFWFEWRLWGLDATGYHVTNILLHALGAFLIWQILERLQVRGAWLAALIFAVHPVNVESVAWVAERKNTLSLVCYALTLLAFLRFEREGNRRWYWSSAGFFLLALLAKTSGVTLPVILLLCAWWQRGKITRRDLVHAAPFFLLSMAFGLLTIWSQQWQLTSATHVIVQRSLPFRLGAAGHVFWFYLFKTLAPLELMTEYPLWKFDMVAWWFWLPTGAVAITLVAAWRFRITWGKPVLFGLLYFGLMLFPVLGVMNMPYIGRSPVVTDHLQYLAMIGIVGLVAAAMARLPRPALNGAGVAVIGACCVLSWTRASQYQDHEKLFRDTLAKNPNATKAHFELANALVKSGSLDEAVAHYRETLRLKPEHADAHCNLANTLARQGKANTAITNFEAAIQLRPRTPEVYYNFGLALVGLDRLDDAITQFERAVDLRPEFTAARDSLAGAHYNRGLALARRGQFTAAIAHFTETVRLDPANAVAQNNLGVALARQGRVGEARVHFAEAVRLNPNDPDYRRNLDESRR